MENEFATLLDRIKAVVIDSCILIIVMYTVSEVLNLFEVVPNYIRISIAAFLFVFYDPIFTSNLGGTIGHTFANITVKKDDHNDENINFFKALLRFLLKASLGWISMLTVTGNKKKKAIHDLAANSVVLKVKRNKSSD